MEIKSEKMKRIVIATSRIVIVTAAIVLMIAVVIATDLEPVAALP